MGCGNIMILVSCELYGGAWLRKGTHKRVGIGSASLFSNPGCIGMGLQTLRSILVSQSLRRFSLTFMKPSGVPQKEGICLQNDLIFLVQLINYTMVAHQKYVYYQCIYMYISI